MTRKSIPTFESFIKENNEKGIKKGDTVIITGGNHEFVNKEAKVTNSYSDSVSVSIDGGEDVLYDNTNIKLKEGLNEASADKEHEKITFPNEHDTKEGIDKLIKGGVNKANFTVSGKFNSILKFINNHEFKKACEILGIGKTNEASLNPAFVNALRNLIKNEASSYCLDNKDDKKNFIDWWEKLADSKRTLTDLKPFLDKIKKTINSNDSWCTDNSDDVDAIIEAIFDMKIDEGNISKIDFIKKATIGYIKENKISYQKIYESKNADWVSSELTDIATEFWKSNGAKFGSEQLGGEIKAGKFAEFSHATNDSKIRPQKAYITTMRGYSGSPGSTGDDYLVIALIGDIYMEKTKHNDKAGWKENTYIAFEKIGNYSEMLNEDTVRDDVYKDIVMKIDDLFGIKEKDKTIHFDDLKEIITHYKLDSIQPKYLADVLKEKGWTIEESANETLGNTSYDEIVKAIDNIYGIKDDTTGKSLHIDDIPEIINQLKLNTQPTFVANLLKTKGWIIEE